MMGVAIWHGVQIEIRHKQMEEILSADSRRLTQIPYSPMASESFPQAPVRR